MLEDRSPSASPSKPSGSARSTASVHPPQREHRKLIHRPPQDHSRAPRRSARSLGVHASPAPADPGSQTPASPRASPTPAREVRHVADHLPGRTNSRSVAKTQQHRRRLRQLQQTRPRLCPNRAQRRCHPIVRFHCPHPQPECTARHHRLTAPRCEHVYLGGQRRLTDERG